MLCSGCDGPGGKVEWIKVRGVMTLSKFDLGACDLQEFM